MPARKRRSAPPEIWSRGGWRRLVAILGAAYCLVAWVLPVVVMLVFRELPYLQERAWPERLALSVRLEIARGLETSRLGALSPRER